MIEWEYRRLTLNDVPRNSSDVELLCQAGEEGWELVAILANNIAYLKRPLDDQGHGRGHKPCLAWTE
jgi:hypothetical protein